MSNTEEHSLPVSPHTEPIKINETMAVMVFTSMRATSCCSAWRRSSHGSTAQSLTCPLCRFLPSSSCDSVYGSNLANRSHIVSLIKFNDSAATSGVWAERRERKDKRRRGGWRRGSFFFFNVAQKVREEVKKNLPTPTRHPLNRLHHHSLKGRFPPSFLVK